LRLKLRGHKKNIPITLSLTHCNQGRPPKPLLDGKLNQPDTLPRIQTRYHLAIALLILLGVLMFAAVAGASVWFEVIHTAELSNRIWWAVFALFCVYMAITGSRLVPFLFVTIALDSEGLTIVKGTSKTLYRWSDITKISYHNRIQILDVYAGKRILSIDYYLKDFSSLSYTLDYYTGSSRPLSL
jgi:hypothetical protein